MSTLSDNVKRLRTLKGLTQKQLAAYLGISAKTISKWETGAGQPEISQIVPLARVFGVSTDELLLGPKPLAGNDRPDGSEPRPIRQALDAINDRYGIPVGFLLQTAGADEKDLRDLIEDKAAIGPDRRRQHDRLVKLILVFYDLIPRFVSNHHLLISTLYTRLRTENELPAETMERYANLSSGKIGAYLSGSYPLTQKEICALIISLFILDSTINRGDAFPWDD